MTDQPKNRLGHSEVSLPIIYINFGERSAVESDQPGV